MDDPKEGGLLTPKLCDWTIYQFCKIALRCVFIFVPNILPHNFLDLYYKSEHEK